MEDRNLKAPPENPTESGPELVRVNPWKYVPHFLLFFILLTLLGLRMEKKTDYGLARVERMWRGSSPLFARVDTPQNPGQLAETLGVQSEDLTTSQFVVEEYMNHLERQEPSSWTRFLTISDGEYYHYFVGKEVFLNAFFALIFASFLYMRERVTKSEQLIISQNTKHQALSDQLEKRIDESTRIIEKLEKIRSKLVEAEKLASIGRLSATLAHEIRNPLSIIKSSTDIITDEVEPDGGGASAVGLIREEIGRMDRIISDLLNFARPKEPNLQILELRQLVRHWLPPIVEELDKENIQVVPEFEHFEDRVIVDPDQLYQVFLNLIWNARDALAGQPNPHIFVRVEAGKKGYACLVVRDTGPGMLPDVLDQICEPFYTTKTKGTGLGLPVSIQLIEGMGGDLAIESEIEIGTVVTLRLRLADEDPRTPSASELALYDTERLIRHPINLAVGGSRRGT